MEVWLIDIDRHAGSGSCKHTGGVMEEFLKILKQRNKIKPYDYLDRSTYPSNSEQREKLFLEPVNEPAEQILKLDDKETN